MILWCKSKDATHDDINNFNRGSDMSLNGKGSVRHIEGRTCLKKYKKNFHKCSSTPYKRFYLC